MISLSAHPSQCDIDLYWFIWISSSCSLPEWHWQHHSKIPLNSTSSTSARRLNFSPLQPLKSFATGMRQENLPQAPENVLQKSTEARWETGKVVTDFHQKCWAQHWLGRVADTNSLCDLFELCPVIEVKVVSQDYNCPSIWKRWRRCSQGLPDDHHRLVQACEATGSGLEWPAQEAKMCSIVNRQSAGNGKRIRTYNILVWTSSVVSTAFSLHAILTWMTLILSAAYSNLAFGSLARDPPSG